MTAAIANTIALRSIAVVRRLLKPTPAVPEPNPTLESGVDADTIAIAQANEESLEQNVAQRSKKMPFEELLANKHYRAGILCGTVILFISLLSGFSAPPVILVGVVGSLLVAGASMLFTKRSN
ncbi:MAG: hypothetical protein HC852_20525 [Acaryochloridaceae cyanobacterium RU_4_10]|nr:hypothetical protein [Acaryochloridaceae cyanobacterium RU_4_10]